MSELTPAAWPLYFTYSGPIIGRGFLASVKFCGRLLASPETEGVWLDGVNPGGFAVGGKSFEDANLQLRETLTKVMVDFAFEADSFETFKGSIERFYHETSDDVVAMWEEGVEALKAGTLLVPPGLQRKPADWNCFIHVEPRRLEELTPQDNPVNRTAVDTALPQAA